jgi:Family of unknown function (DUF6918)
MATLHDMLLAPDVLPRVNSDVLALVDTELASKSGMSGTALKVAFKAVTAFAPGYYQEAVSAMVPPMVDRLAPFWADFQVSGSADFGDYLSKRSDEVSQALLTVTDAMADHSGRAAVVKAYRAVRGGAGKHIEAALPNLGAMVQKYAY